MSNIANVRPCNTRILVLPDTAVGETAGGVILAEKDQHRPQIGTIIKKGRKVNYLNEGDRVMYGKSVGMPFDIPDEEGITRTYYIMNEQEIAMTMVPENKQKAKSAL